MRSLQDEILIASLQSQLLIENAKLKAINDNLNQFRDNGAYSVICIAVRDEIRRQLNNLTIRVIP